MPIWCNKKLWSECQSGITRGCGPTTVLAQQLSPGKTPGSHGNMTAKTPGTTTRSYDNQKFWYDKRESWYDRGIEILLCTCKLCKHLKNESCTCDRGTHGHSGKQGNTSFSLT